MTALYFHWLRAGDRVSVKPHASPVLHADQLPAGAARPRVPDDAARLRRPAVVPARARRTPTRSTSRPARSASAPRRPCSPASSTATCEAHFGLGNRPPLRGADRRRRARRGQRLGGHLRHGHARPRQRHVDRRLQPPEPRPRRAGHPLGASSRRCSPTTAGTSSRSSTAPRLRAAYALRRRRDAAPAHRRDAERRVPEPAAAAGRARSATRCVAGAPRRRTAASWRACSRTTPTRTLAALIGDLAGHDLGDVHRRRSRRCDAETRAAERHLRVHRQGLGPADRRPPAEPLRRAQPAADRRAARGAGRPRRRVGGVRPASPPRRRSAPLAASG